MSFISRFFDFINENELLPNQFCFYQNAMIDPVKKINWIQELKRRKEYETSNNDWRFEHQRRQSNIVDLMTYHGRSVMSKQGEYTSYESIHYILVIADSQLSIARETTLASNWREHLHAAHTYTAEEWNNPIETQSNSQNHILHEQLNLF